MPDMETRVSTIEQNMGELQRSIIAMSTAILELQQEVRNGFRSLGAKIDDLQKITENGFRQVGFISPKDD